MFIFGYLIFTIFVYFGSSELLIKEITAPGSIEYGTTDDVVLDCNYEVQDETGLVIKWFYNGMEDLIYQWIPIKTDKPYASGSLKNNIDLEYKTSDDNITKYRSLRLTNIKPELSGNYTCEVSSFMHEAVLTKQLVIYSPATDFELLLMDGEYAVCSVYQVSPKPEINLYIVDQNSTAEERVSVVDDDGLYNITVELAFNTSAYNLPIKFVCELWIPGTNYTLTKTAEHFEESLETNLDAEEDYYLNLNINATSFNATRENKSTGRTDNSSVPHSCSSILLITLLFITMSLIN